jgi:hypothetical protein
MPLASLLIAAPAFLVCAQGTGGAALSSDDYGLFVMKRGEVPLTAP